MEAVEGLSRDSRLWLEQLEKETPVTFAMTPYTVATADDILLCNTSGGAITVTLPPAGRGRRLTILRITGANNVTVNPSGSDTIDGAASATVTASYTPLRLKATSGGWYSA